MLPGMFLSVLPLSLVSSFFQVTYAQSLPAKYLDPMDIQEIPQVEGPSVECVSLAARSISSSSNIANLWVKRGPAGS